MTDIVKRLRTWCHAVDAESAQDLMDEAAAEIERLRNGAVCPHVRGTVTQHCSLNLTLTDAEREAISLAYSRLTAVANYESIAATLQALLARTNHDAVPEAIARTESASCGRGCGGTDKPVTLPAMGAGDTTLDGAPAVEAGAGKPQISHPQAGNTQTAPPCVETDGPPSQGEGLNIPHSRTRLSEAEIDALEYVVEEGRIACMDDYGILRSLLVRVRPEWESKSYEESDDKRMNTNTNRETTHSEGSMHEGCALTDAERLALEFAVGTGRVATHDVATLRSLLERLA